MSNNKQTAYSKLATYDSLVDTLKELILVLQEGTSPSGGDASSANQLAIKKSIDDGFDSNDGEIAAFKSALIERIGNLEETAWSGTGTVKQLGVLKGIFKLLEKTTPDNTANFITVTGASTHPAGAYSVGFHNEGTGDMTVASGTLSPGSSVTFTARPGSKLNAISYNTEGSGNLHIAEVR